VSASAVWWERAALREEGTLSHGGDPADDPKTGKRRLPGLTLPSQTFDRLRVLTNTLPRLILCSPTPL